MASEKGATYLDKLCHKFYDEPKGNGKATDYTCRLCGGRLETFYCEERLYLVKCADCGTLALIKTASPGIAVSITLAKPTLTPQNEWISVEDRLPQSIINKVLVYCENGYIGYGHYEKYQGEETWYNLESGEPFASWNLENCSPYKVTHWMPLPKSPKEDG